VLFEDKKLSKLKKKYQADDSANDSSGAKAATPADAAAAKAE